MAITTLDTSGASGDKGAGLETFSCLIDYDSTAKTVGITATGSASDYIATFTSNKGSFSYNVAKLGILNAGRKVLLGPGSIIGQTAPVTTQPTGVVVPWNWSS